MLDFSSGVVALRDCVASKPKAGNGFQECEPRLTATGCRALGGAR